jgi:hypothetical protein
MVANAASRRGCARARRDPRPARRARLGGQHARRPGGLRRRRGPRRAAGAVRPGGRRAGLRRLPRPQAGAGRGRLQRPAAAHRRGARGARRRREEFRSRYRSFVVDEYQDVTPLQQRLLDAWLGGRDDLCVVGDAHQTIYSFTGATPSFLLAFRSRFPHGQEVRLVRDYRSTPQVVGLANAVIGKAVTPVGATAWPRLELLAQQPAGPAPAFAEHADEPAEADAVAARCAQLLAAGTPASEIAVLYRVNAQSAAYEAALANAGCPTWCGAASASSTARRCARRCCCCAAPGGRPTTTPRPASPT